MLSLSQISSAGAASSYYQSDNYYTKGGQGGKSAWFGGGADILKIQGKTVDTTELEKILSGELPNGQTKANNKKKHIPGYDLTFSAPKSVSLMALIYSSNKEAWISAHEEAVKSALLFVEKEHLRTRKYNKKAGKQDIIGGQKMLAALIEHDISRNEDPQLHTHSLVANACSDETGKFRAIHSSEIFQNRDLIGEVYRTELKANIRKFGLGSIERTHLDGRFEVKGMDKALLHEFSTRSQDIKEYLGEGAHSAEDKANAALRTRKAKKEMFHDIIHKDWLDRTAKHGHSSHEIERTINDQYRYDLISDALIDVEELKATALKNSVEHLSETSSTFPYRDVLRYMLAEGMGHFRVDAAQEHISQAIDNGWLKESLDGSLFYTEETLNREMGTLELEKTGRSVVDPIMEQKNVPKSFDGKALTDGQFNASQLILTSPNRVIGVQGYAGVGKTFMLASVAEQAKKMGHNVLGLAPTILAAETLGQEANINTQTIHRYLLTPSGNEKTILFVDEASQATTDQTLDLLSTTALREVAKVVLIGDTKQLNGVGAGAPFRMLQSEGMRYVVIDEIKRQKKLRHLEAVKSASNGDIDRAFKKLGDDIREVPLEGISKHTADAWLNSKDRKTAAIVVTTNAFAKSINEHIKTALIEECSISSEGVEITSLQPIHMSEMQKKYADSYKGADMIRFNRNYHQLGVMAGDTLALNKVRDDGVIELTKNGETIHYSPNGHATGKGAVEAFIAEPMTINQGDKIRWTRPDYANAIKNMDQGSISKIDQDQVTVKMINGREVSYGKEHVQLSFLRHAWAQTGHAYQGQTVDHIIAAMPSSSILSNQKSFYVDISRAREEITFITDDVERLNRNLKANTGEQLNALDLVREKEAAQGFDTHQSPPNEQQIDSSQQQSKPSRDISR